MASLLVLEPSPEGGEFPFDPSSVQEWREAIRSRGNLPVIACLNYPSHRGLSLPRGFNQVPTTRVRLPAV